LGGSKSPTAAAAADDDNDVDVIIELILDVISFADFL
jgi:hypothetical protein